MVLPRLVVLSVLSAASSPCSDLNLIHYIEQKVGKIRKVSHFENEIEHKILVTYVIAKVSDSTARRGNTILV